jgi:hypothetical protein
MIEGFINKTEEHMEMKEKNIDNLLSKKGFDVQKKMKSSFNNSATLRPQFHNPISLPPNSATIQSHQRSSYCLAQFSQPQPSSTKGVITSTEKSPQWQSINHCALQQQAIAHTR